MKNKKILIISLGTFTVISLVLALILSPLRGLDSSKLNILDESKAVLGVNFNGKIKNARDVVNYQYMTNSSLNIIGVNNSTSNARASQNISNGVSRNFDNNITGIGNFDKNPTNGVGNTFNSIGNSSNRNSNSVSPSNINIGLLSSTPINNAKKINITTGVVSLTTDLTKASSASTKFNAGAGGPPPSEGGENPPPSLPIGDGMNYLLVLAIVFAGFKARKILV